MTFTCPFCRQMIVCSANVIDPQIEQMLIGSVPGLQSHMQQHHHRTLQRLMQLSAQYSAALFLKSFILTDKEAIAARASLYDACVKTLTDEWQIGINREAQNTLESERTFENETKQ